MGGHPHRSADLVGGSLQCVVRSPTLERSTDLGKTWEPAPSPAFPDGSDRRLLQVWSLAAAPDGGTLAGVAEAALFASPDGLEWELNEGLEGHPTRPGWEPGAGGLCAHSIVPDAAQPDRVYVGISAVGGVPERRRWCHLGSQERGRRGA